MRVNGALAGGHHIRTSGQTSVRACLEDVECNTIRAYESACEAVIKIISAGGNVVVYCELRNLKGYAIGVSCRHASGCTLYGYEHVSQRQL